MDSAPPAWVTGLLWVIVSLSVIFFILIFFLPLGVYRLIGNFSEVIVAFFCMACCLYAYRYVSDRIIFPLAAFAFFGYALSNLFWHFYSITLGRAFVYTSVSEIGFFCFFLFFISAIIIEFPKQKMPVALVVLLMVSFLLIPLIITWGVCINLPLHFALFALRLLLIEQLIEATIRHGVFRYPLLCAGICLHCVGSLLYGIRDTLVINNPGVFLPGPIPGSEISLYNFLSIVGPIFIGSFALIMLGLFSYVRQVSPADPCSGSDA